jgi:Restriction endonuclease
VLACRDEPPTSREKGQRLENLMTWLIAYLPGFVVKRRNAWSSSGAQEVDLVVWNEQHPGGFPSFSSKMLIECKNTADPVDSRDVAWFYWKMRLGGVNDGILAAANGITGDVDRQTAAREIVALANAEERHIMVVDLASIASLTSREALRGLLIDRQLGLVTRS